MILKYLWNVYFVSTMHWNVKCKIAIYYSGVFWKERHISAIFTFYFSSFLFLSFFLGGVQLVFITAPLHPADCARDEMVRHTKKADNILPIKKLMKYSKKKLGA